ncbi:hypothetical protein PspLS_03664 [Pyricularia sp. CBS 133598]|nr:hypothetical protein PspLS_03664 [Pyricularia sp. CBS 133598]
MKRGDQGGKALQSRGQAKSFLLIASITAKKGPEEGREKQQRVAEMDADEAESTWREWALKEERRELGNPRKLCKNTVRRRESRCEEATRSLTITGSKQRFPPNLHSKKKCDKCYTKWRNEQPRFLSKMARASERAWNTEEAPPRYRKKR